MELWDKYAEDVLSGKAITGRAIRLAVERYEKLKSKYTFLPEKVKEKLTLVSTLRHYTGKFAGKNFILEPWQQFIMASIYGFYKEDGTRLTRSVYIEMARKQGKSSLAAAICLCQLIYDNEANAEVYLAANSKDQAKISFGMCSNFCRSIDPGKKYLVPYRDRIKYDRTLSILRVLAADDSKLDGFNASTYLLDEYHASKSSKLKDVLQSSQAMRKNPLSIIITTAGFDKDSPCYRYRATCSEVLHGLKEDDSLFAAIYCIDEEDDWKDESVWIKASPNLGVTVGMDFIRGEVLKAKNNPSDEVGIKTKTMNVWCDSEEVWIPESYIIQQSQKLDLNGFAGEEAFAGIDLASTSDLTALSVMIPRPEGLYFFTHYYLPESALIEKRFAERYGEWRRNGSLTITPGNVTDYDYILKDLINISNVVTVTAVGYDQWNATQFTISATEQGANMQPVSQAIGNFNKPTKEMERLILSGHAFFDSNEITRFCFRNVVIKNDWNDNAKPVKQFRENKIDGVISCLMALYQYLNSDRYNVMLT